MNRALNYDFEYPEPDEEDAQLAVKITNLMNNDDQTEAPGLRRKFSAEDVKPIGDLTRHLREAHRTNPDVFVDFPDGRQAAYMFMTLAFEAYRANEGDSLADAITTMSHTQGFLLPGARNMTSRERNDTLRDQFTGFTKGLNELAQLAHKVRLEDDEQIAAAKARKKANPRKPRSGKKQKAATTA